MEDLVQLYNNLKDEIENHLDKFDDIWENGSNKDLYKEMIFCLCTPQTNAKNAWKAVERLDELDYIENGSFEEIAFILKENGVRFHKNKTKYIIKNRNYFNNIKELISPNNGDIVNTRNKLAENILGWGMKEASHFLRNIGFGEKLSILDRHILRQLSEYSVIPKIPQTMKKNEYIKIENDMKHFAKELKIPLNALDFIFWYKAKGELFK